MPNKNIQKPEVKSGKTSNDSEYKRESKRYKLLSESTILKIQELRDQEKSLKRTEKEKLYNNRKQQEKNETYIDRVTKRNQNLKNRTMTQS